MIRQLTTLTFHSVITVATTALVPLLLAASQPLSAQDLSLFEPVVNENRIDNIDAQQNREQNAVATVPAFTLIGTSRIGGKYRATLATSSGEIVVVTGNPGSVQDIPDHPGYRLVDIGSRRASIANPGGSPCIAAADKGVTCGADGLSLLSLATAAPVPAAQSAEAATAYNDSAAAPQPGEIPENPFAAALRAAALNEANSQAQAGTPAPPGAERFQPRRIAPEDVPQGMRVVRTPFGDRLVEQ
ncbi:MAG: hypothetical protein Q7V56_08180 [Gammaproteobacteria bacterium]|nr:hypothetical protein [Gammaproteobacteria bacterium]